MKLRRVVETITITIYLVLMITCNSILATDNQSEAKIDIFKEEYVEYYLRSKRNFNLDLVETRDLTEVYIKERQKGKDFYYADYYAILTVLRKLKEDVAREQTKVYVQEKKKNRSYNYADYYSMLKVDKKMKDDVAKFRAEVYEKEINKGKDFNYVDYYAMLRVESKLSEEEARVRADIYIQKIKEGKEKCYSDCYSILMAEMGLSEEESDIKAKLYEKEISSMGNLIQDIEYYVKCRLRGMEKLETLGFMILYNQELKQSKSREYSKYYSNMIIFFDKDDIVAREMAEVFEKEVIEGNKSSIYVDYYIYLLKKGSNKELARIQAEIYEKNIKLGIRKKELDKAEKEESYKIYKKNIQEKIYEEAMNTRDRKDTREIIYASYYSKVKVNQIWRNK